MEGPKWAPWIVANSETQTHDAAVQEFYERVPELIADDFSTSPQKKPQMTLTVPSAGWTIIHTDATTNDAETWLLFHAPTQETVALIHDAPHHALTIMCSSSVGNVGGRIRGRLVTGGPARRYPVEEVPTRNYSASDVIHAFGVVASTRLKEEELTKWAAMREDVSRRFQPLMRVQE